MERNMDGSNASEISKGVTTAEPSYLQENKTQSVREESRQFKIYMEQKNRRNGVISIGTKGFTILEMLIVLSIISLIFTLTLPNIQTRLATIREKGCESLVDVVNSNIIEYELEHEEIPTSMEQLLDAGLIKEKQMKCPNGDAIDIVDGQAVRDGE